MPYAHKLDVYLDPPYKKIVFCVYCGQDTNLSGPCPGEIKMTAKDDENFMRIFGGAPVKASKELKVIIAARSLKCS